MKSPFPGMDPFLERHWPDVHARLISYVADTLQPQLAEDLTARIEENVYVDDSSDNRPRIPDVQVVHNPTAWRPEPGAVGTAVLDKPILLERVDDQTPERSVLIYDADGARIVTAIEILSPRNKSTGKGVEKYLAKREKYLESDTNLIEIDLVRKGDWTSMLGPISVPEGVQTTYRVTVSKPELDGLYLYPVSMQSRLPTIAVPLRRQDPPAVLNLQELIEKAYTMGRYNRIDYTKPCYPPLIGPELAWAQELLQAAKVK